MDQFSIGAVVDRVRALHRRDDGSPHGPWCGTCLTAWPCRTFAALDHPTEETPDPGAYIYITYGPWDSSGHQCGDLTVGGCDEPVPSREVTVRTFKGAQVIGHELGDCPDHPTEIKDTA